VNGFMRIGRMLPPSLLNMKVATVMASVRKELAPCLVQRRELQSCYMMKSLALSLPTAMAMLLTCDWFDQPGYSVYRNPEELVSKHTMLSLTVSVIFVQR